MDKNKSVGNYSLRPNYGRSSRPSGGGHNDSAKPPSSGTPNPNYTPPASVKKSKYYKYEEIEIELKNFIKNL